MSGRRSSNRRSRTFLDYSLIADSTANLEDGILTFIVDLRPKD